MRLFSRDKKTAWPKAFRERTTIWYQLHSGNGSEDFFVHTRDRESLVLLLFFTTSLFRSLILSALFIFIRSQDYKESISNGGKSKSRYHWYTKITYGVEFHSGAEIFVFLFVSKFFSIFLLLNFSGKQYFLWVIRMHAGQRLFWIHFSIEEYKLTEDRVDSKKANLKLALVYI